MQSGVDQKQISVRPSITQMGRRCLRKNPECRYLPIITLTVTSFCTGRVANSQYNNVVNKMTLITYEYVYLVPFENIVFGVEQ